MDALKEGAKGLLLVVFVFIFFVAGYCAYTGTGFNDLFSSPPPDAEVFDDGSYVVLDDPPSEEEIETMDAKETNNVLKVPSVGIETQLQSMNTYRNAHGDKIINPYLSKHAYHVRDWGELGQKEDMIVIAAHSIKGKPDIPGSKLIDIEAGRSTLSDGDEIEIDDFSYEVSEIHTMNKNTVVDSDVWENEEGKLLIFTCLQRQEGRSVDNIIIEAHLAE